MSARIRAIDVHLEVPFAISRAVRTEKRLLLVEQEDDGRIARGEASPDPYFGDTLEDLERDIAAALPLLPDDPRDLAGALDRLAQRFPRGGPAACALDILSHDRAAQAAGLPLRRFLGLPDRDAPSTSFTIGIAEPQRMAERAAVAAERGFEVLKVKLGGGGDELAILAAIRERFSGAIRVDPNAGWTVDEAPDRIAAIEPFGIEFVEQPVDPRDIDGLARVHARSPLPIVADEAAVRVEDLEVLAGACDGINVKLQKCGGIAPALAMIERAHALGLRVMLGCRAAETSVAIAAAAHLAPLVEWADLDGNLLIVDDPFVAVGVERGRFRFSDRPGLGARPR